MRDRDAAPLIHIFTAATFIVQHTGVLQKSEFLTDAVLQKAVLYELLTIGEAVKRLSAEFQQKHADIPWSSIARTRDRVIHGYDRIDLNIIWNIITADIPTLLHAIQPLLPTEEA